MIGSFQINDSLESFADHQNIFDDVSGHSPESITEGSNTEATDFSGYSLQSNELSLSVRPHTIDEGQVVSTPETVVLLTIPGVRSSLARFLYTAPYKRQVLAILVLAILAILTAWSVLRA